MKRDIAGIFAALGERLEGFADAPRTQAAIDDALMENPWFTRGDIVRSVEAIRTHMLCEDKLRRWLAAYPALPAAHPAAVGVIMAGNIPLAGFFDLLCVLAAGHACYYKPSSKDRSLIDHVVSQLRGIWPQAPVYTYIGQSLDAVIATGSDNSKRSFRNKYRDIPALLRGSRASAAVLAGDETDGELAALASDIFSYSGLGCRSVSHLILPCGYDPQRLLHVLNAHPLPNPKYRNNFMQRSAVLAMRQGQAMVRDGEGRSKIYSHTREGKTAPPPPEIPSQARKDEMAATPYIIGDFYLLNFGEGFPASVSEITYRYYDSMDEVREWLTAHEGEIQCVVGRADTGFPRTAGFGQAQSPALADYPDGIDVMEFLANI